MRDAALFNQAAMPDQEEFVATGAGRGIGNEEVVGFDRAGNQLLADQYFIGAADGIAQPGGAFIVELLRSFEHLAAQAVQQVFALAAQEGAHLFNGFTVLLYAAFIDAAATGAGAATQVQAQAGDGWFGLRRQSLCAGANGKDFLHQLNSQINDTPTAEGAKVARAIGCHLASSEDTCKRVLDVDFDEGIQFVVAQLHVIGRLQLLNQLRLDQQRFQFGAKHARLDLFHILQQAIHFARIPQWLVIIRGQAIFQALGLADVDDLLVRIFHQINTGRRGKVTFPGRIEEKRPGGAYCSRLIGDPPIRAQLLDLLFSSNLRNISVPGNGQLQAAAQVSQRLHTLLLRQREQFDKDGSRHPGITQGAVPVRGGYLQVIGHVIQFEAAQGWQEAARQGNSIQSIDGEVESQQARLVGEKAEIEADIMPNKDSAIDEIEKIGEDFSSSGRGIHHLLRDAGKLHDERGQACAGIEQGLERAKRFAPAHAHSGDFDDAMRTGTQTCCFGIKHDKFNLVQGAMRAAPRRERPVRVFQLLK